MLFFVRGLQVPFCLFICLLLWGYSLPDVVLSENGCNQTFSCTKDWDTFIRPVMISSHKCALGHPGTPDKGRSKADIRSVASHPRSITKYKEVMEHWANGFCSCIYVIISSISSTEAHVTAILPLKNYPKVTWYKLTVLGRT